ncbi:putative glutamine amidotransferase [Pasteurella canis]|uniref:Putative glutamine amidotransferase n=1 Tax=Pasteurella canis TaxID=753 RepID=A0A379GG73_9PAST|nr:putative glutamine amidotransferase [Pasteurella canis]
MFFRDNNAAHSSPIADCVKQYHIKSLNVIAHIRKATQGEVNIENTHPFIRELWGQNWVFAHNGNLTTKFDLNNSLYQPIGSTDSEAAFCYMVSELKTRLKSSLQKMSYLMRYNKSHILFRQAVRSILSYLMVSG